MTDNKTAAPGVPNSSLALNVNYYLGTRVLGSNWIYEVHIDGTDDNSTVTARANASLRTIASGARLLIMEINGSYFILATIPTTV